MTTPASLGASQAAATGTLDYSDFASEQNGPIYLDLPEPTLLPLKTVLELHRTSPTTFEWCR